MITLQLIERYGPDGWQDEEGVIWYDTDFETPFGLLGNVSVKKIDGQWVIKQADGVAIFARGFIDSLLNGYEDESTTVHVSPLGTVTTVLIKASNGQVRYQLHMDELGWSDQPGEAVKGYLATLTYQEWDAED